VRYRSRRRFYFFDNTGFARAHTHRAARPCLSGKQVMKKNLLILAALAVMLAGCVVVPARPMYVHAPRVVVY
jgi:hypothetical protein